MILVLTRMHDINPVLPPARHLQSPSLDRAQSYMDFAMDFRDMI